jgi:hypothetical protein
VQRTCSFIQPRLFQNTLLSLWIEFHGRVPRDCGRPEFLSMMILTVASFLTNLHPSVAFDDPNRISHLHSGLRLFPDRLPAFPK